MELNYLLVNLTFKTGREPAVSCICGGIDMICNGCSNSSLNCSIVLNSSFNYTILIFSVETITGLPYFFILPSFVTVMLLKVLVNIIGFRLTYFSR